MDRLSVYTVGKVLAEEHLIKMRICPFATADSTDASLTGPPVAPSPPRCRPLH